MSRADLERFCIAAINQGRFRGVTGPLSKVYGACVHARHWLYDRGWLKTHRAPLPVLSVGNVVMGGSGKTQLVLLLARTLRCRLAILSRGVGGSIKKGQDPLRVEPDQHPVEVSGDEPWLLARALPQAQVWVHPDRYRSACAAWRAGVEWAILDDGMQHRRLHRTIELVVLGGEDPLGGGHFFPRGWLREARARLERADYLFFVGDPAPGVVEQIRRWTTAPYIVAKVSVEGIPLHKGGELETLRGVRVGLFAGIGNPHRVAATVEDEGGLIVERSYLPDHVGIGREKLEAFSARCREKGAEYLLCTEKDYVKLPREIPEGVLPIGYVKVALEISDQREVWEGLIERITLFPHSV